LKILNKIHW